MVTARTGIPDFEHIKQKVPIHEIARQLNLDVIGNSVRCWRPENHQHGDRTPSVGLDKRRNRARCFVCDGKALSVIDFVMSVLGVALSEAIRWIVKRHPVPDIPKGSHFKPQQRWPERFRVEPVLRDWSCWSGPEFGHHSLRRSVLS